MTRKQLLNKISNSRRRSSRVRSVVKGTSKRPRLSVHFSHLHITAQLIDDEKQASIIYVSTVGQKTIGQTMTDKAAWVGKTAAERAKAAKIKQVVFDRGSKPYHGRVAALAEAARQGGLEF